MDGPGESRTHTPLAGPRILSPLPGSISTENAETCERAADAPTTGPTIPAQDSAPENPPYTPTDPDLARVVSAWPALPDPIRRAMLALIETSKGAA